MEEPIVFHGGGTFVDGNYSDSDSDIHLPSKPVAQSLRPS